MAVQDQNLIGASTPRVDGRLKVTGEARYGSDVSVANPAYAVLVTSSIAKGRIKSIDATDAQAVEGCLQIVTHETISGQIRPTKFFAEGGYVGSSIMPLGSDAVAHWGQIVAVAVGDTFEAAREAAYRLKIAYVAEAPSATFDSPGTKTVAAKDVSLKHEDPQVGDAESAYHDAPVRVDAEYETPTQHHNPIELFATTCVWQDRKLVVFESSQNVYGFKNGLAEQLNMSADDIRVVSPYVGGAFGSRGSLTQRTAIIAVIARSLNRPVKLVATRTQGFTIATYRAETRHHIRLGADRNGKLLSLIHEGWEVTSRPDNYMVSGTDASTRLYACPNVGSKVSIVHADRNTPGFMRSPPEVPYLFALESAMDELAEAVGVDPIEIRRLNDTQNEPIRQLPYTSRALMRCFDEGARQFGWMQRTPQPGSMRDGDWVIGWGCASTMYPTQMAPATVRVTLTPQGLVKVQTAAHDIGTGAYTVIAQTAADYLGAYFDNVAVALGDSDFPPAPVAGGSNTTASLCNVVAKACLQIRYKIAQAAVKAEGGTFSGRDPASLTLQNGTLTGQDGARETLQSAMRRVANGAIEVYAENIPDGVDDDGVQKLYRGIQSIAGGAKLKDRIQFAFGAVFAEVRVHAHTREVRCPRLVGAFTAGRIMNPRTAQSQLMGGLIWGASAALLEATEIDRNDARYYNADLAEYLIPVNADIKDVNVVILPEEDPIVNALGIKGLGELGNVGTNAAVANAVYHATGTRVRTLPVRIEHLLQAPAIPV
jgi:xanthine dehydrogenase YagR molybdenum-binding subunit